MTRKTPAAMSPIPAPPAIPSMVRARVQAPGRTMVAPTPTANSRLSRASSGGALSRLDTRAKRNTITDCMTPSLMPERTKWGTSV